MYYFDTSALVKLVLPERESAALSDWWSPTAGQRITSALTRTELIRAVRIGAPEREDTANQLLRTVDELEIDRSLLARAAAIGPPLLRTLDAIHLASAELLGSDLRAVVTYDRRLTEATARLGIPVVSPA